MTLNFQKIHRMFRHHNKFFHPQQNFSGVFQSLLEQQQLTKSQVIRDSGLDRTYAYQIINGSKAPARGYGGQ